MRQVVKLEITITCFAILLIPFVIPASALMQVQQSGSSITITHLVQLSRYVAVMGTWASDTISCKLHVNPIVLVIPSCQPLTTSVYGGKVIVEWGDGSTSDSKIIPNNSQVSNGNWMPVEHFYYVPSNVAPYSTLYTIIAKLIGPNNELLASTSQDVLI